MADIGLSGSGLGVASLALQLGDSIMRLKSFWDAVKDAPEDIKHLLEEIETLSSVFSDFETSNSARPEFNIGNRTTSRCLNLCKNAAGVLQNVAKEAEVEIQKRKRIGSVKAVLKRCMIEKLRDRLITAQSMLMLSNNLYLVDLQKRNQQAHHDWAHSHQEELRELRLIVSQSTETILSARFRGSCQSDLMVAGPISPGLQPASLRTRGLKLKARLKTPKWLFGVSRAVEIYESCANAGWNFNIRVYNVVPNDSPQFKMAGCGDIVGIQQLFSSGQASPYDRNQYGTTLLDIAATRHDLSLCRLLKNEGADPKVSAFGTALVAACGIPEDLTRPDMLNDIVLFLAQDLELVDPFEETSSEGMWVRFQGNVETFSWLLRASHSTHQNRSLEECVLFALKICRYNSPNMSRLIRLILNNRKINRQMCEFQGERDNTALFHCASQNLGSLFSSSYFFRVPTSEDIEHICTFVRDLVKGGSDLHSIALSRFTPMLELLTSYMSYSWYSNNLSPHLDDNCPLRKWLKVLHDSGVDLNQCGREEKRLLISPHVCREWLCYEFDRSGGIRSSLKLRLTNFIYGPNPSDWMFWIAPVMQNYFVDFWDMVDHPERAMPGAWCLGGWMLFRKLELL